VAACVERGSPDDTAPDDTADTAVEDTDTAVEDTDTAVEDTSDTAPDNTDTDVTIEIPFDGLGLEVLLTWTVAGDDLDLHLLAPGGELGTNLDCHQANCIDWGINAPLDWGVGGYPLDNPALTFDDTAGTGPESIRIRIPAAGTYTVGVRDYPTEGQAAPNPFTVEIRFDEVTIGTFTGEAITEDAYVMVATVTLPAGTTAPWTAAR